MTCESRPPAWENSTVKNRVKWSFDKPKKIREIFWSRRPDSNRGPPVPKAVAENLSCWSVWLCSASWYSVLDLIWRHLDLSWTQVPPLDVSEVFAFEDFVAFACELEDLRVLRVAVERDEERIAHEARVTIEIVIDRFAQVAVCRGFVAKHCINLPEFVEHFSVNCRGLLIDIIQVAKAFDRLLMNSEQEGSPVFGMQEGRIQHGSAFELDSRTREIFHVEEAQATIETCASTFSHGHRRQECFVVACMKIAVKGGTDIHQRVQAQRVFPFGDGLVQHSSIEIRFRQPPVGQCFVGIQM